MRFKPLSFLFLFLLSLTLTGAVAYVDRCTSLASNNEYILVKNLSSPDGPCIVIEGKENVLLDLNGSSVTPRDFGILIKDSQNVTIKNSAPSPSKISGQYNALVIENSQDVAVLGKIELSARWKNKLSLNNVTNAFIKDVVISSPCEPATSLTIDASSNVTLENIKKESCAICGFYPGQYYRDDGAFVRNSVNVRFSDLDFHGNYRTFTLENVGNLSFSGGKISSKGEVFYLSNTTLSLEDVSLDGQLLFASPNFQNVSITTTNANFLDLPLVVVEENTTLENSSLGGIVVINTTFQGRNLSFYHFEIHGGEARLLHVFANHSLPFYLLSYSSFYMENASVVGSYGLRGMLGNLSLKNVNFSISKRPFLLGNPSLLYYSTLSLSSCPTIENVKVNDLPLAYNTPLAHEVVSFALFCNSSFSIENTTSLFGVDVFSSSGSIRGLKITNGSLGMVIFDSDVEGRRVEINVSKVGVFLHSSFLTLSSSLINTTREEGFPYSSVSGCGRECFQEGMHVVNSKGFVLKDSLIEGKDNALLFERGENATFLNTTFYASREGCGNGIGIFRGKRLLADHIFINAFSASRGILAEDVSVFTINNSLIKGGERNGEIANSDNIVVENSVMKDALKDNFLFTVGRSSRVYENLTVINNTFSNAPGLGVGVLYVSGSAFLKNFHFSDNVVRNVTDALVLSGLWKCQLFSPKAQLNAYITNNLLNSSRLGLALSSSQNGYVCNNTISSPTAVLSSCLYNYTFCNSSFYSSLPLLPFANESLYACGMEVVNITNNGKPLAFYRGNNLTIANISEVGGLLLCGVENSSVENIALDGREGEKGMVLFFSNNNRFKNISLYSQYVAFYSFRSFNNTFSNLFANLSSFDSSAGAFLFLQSDNNSLFSSSFVGSGVDGLIKVASGNILFHSLNISDPVKSIKTDNDKLPPSNLLRIDIYSPWKAENISIFDSHLSGEAHFYNPGKKIAIVNVTFTTIFFEEKGEGYNLVDNSSGERIISEDSHLNISHTSAERIELKEGSDYSNVLWNNVSSILVYSSHVNISHNHFGSPIVSISPPSTDTFGCGNLWWISNETATAVTNASCNPGWVEEGYISPSPAYNSANLSCSILYNHEDPYPGVAEFRWWRNGVLLGYYGYGSGNPNEWITTNQALPANETDVGDNITCEARVFDGYHWSEWKNFSTTIIEDTCGISINTTSVDFSSLPTNAISEEISVRITNTGTLAGDYSINGSDWQGPSFFPVNFTRWSLVSSNYSSKTPLTYEPSFIATIDGGDSISLFLQVATPLGEENGTYNQTITVIAECD